MQPVNYRCRNDFVLFRLVDRGEHRGLAMPNIAQQGKDRVVVAVGPKVEDLKVGDRVLVIGSIGMDVVQVPADSTLYMTKEVNVTLVELPTE